MERSAQRKEEEKTMQDHYKNTQNYLILWRFLLLNQPFLILRLTLKYGSVDIDCPYPCLCVNFRQTVQEPYGFTMFFKLQICCALLNNELMQYFKKHLHCLNQ